jgi:hypothetical protein
MSGLIISTRKKTDLQLFADLAKRLGVKTKMVTDEELLDFGLLKAMEEGRGSKFVSTDIIMQKLI